VYSPKPPSGVPCGEGNACPSGQACIAGYCGGDGPLIDVNEIVPDLMADDMTAPLCQSWNMRHFDACGLPQPLGDLVLTEAAGDYVWDTTDGALTGKMNTPVSVVTTVLSQTDGPDVLVASVNNFTLDTNAHLDITGSRPILIAVNGTATINGEIDANGFFSSPGPGGTNTLTTLCPAAQTGNGGAAAVASGAAGTGGGGGGFGANGGDGGNAGGQNGVGFASSPTVIRGGCAGGSGGAGSAGTVGTRGAGGGGIVISARVAIVLGAGGSINAGGGAGSFGRANYGAGGGGGSGGLIGLDAPTLTIDGVLAANGGGGGGGASDTTNGVSGSNAAATGTEASGGNGAATTTVGPCSRGGNGGAEGDPTGDTGATSLCGGGGGGGGVGYVLFWSASPTVSASATISPAAQSGL
jgi:hypothetical protein